MSGERDAAARGAIAIFVKTPGRSPVKTRLAAAIGAPAARAWHARAAAVVAEVAVAAARVSGAAAYFAVAEADAIADAAWAALPCLPQGPGGLGERMGRVHDALVRRHGAGVLLGADAPQLAVGALVDTLAWCRAAEPRQVLGPARDGGFWLYAGNRTAPQATWEAVAYSRPDTAERFRAAFASFGAFRELGALADVDHAEDLHVMRRELAALTEPTPAQRALRAWLDAGGLGAAEGGGTVSDATLVAYEPLIRVGAFVSVLGVLALVERARPCRGDARPAWRQAVNLALVVLDTLVLRVVFPIVGIGIAARLRADGVGLFAAVGWSEPIEIALAALALDLVIYAQHRVFHRVPLLWRAHRVHHSDLAFDVTLGVRFHPLEIVLSQALKLAAIAVLGAAPLAVLLFELVLQAGALFTHADVALPGRAERWARWLVVTPSLHRVHHSIARDETDSNFGFSVVWWDRIFGTFRAAPRLPEATMPVGVEEFRAPEALGLVALLAQPFTAPPPAPREVPHAG